MNNFIVIILSLKYHNVRWIQPDLSLRILFLSLKKFVRIHDWEIKLILI